MLQPRRFFAPAPTRNNSTMRFGGLSVRHAIRHHQVRHEIKIRLAVKTESQFPAVKTPVQFAGFLRPLDERMDEFKVAFALCRAWHRSSGTSPGAANMVAKEIRISSRFWWK